MPGEDARPVLVDGGVWLSPVDAGRSLSALRLVIRDRLRRDGSTLPPDLRRLIAALEIASATVERHDRGRSAEIVARSEQQDRITPDTAAALLDVTRRQAERLCANRWRTATLTRRRWSVDRAEVEQYARAREEAA